jgi:tetratricopeptide (TPR) repeat protein
MLSPQQRLQNLLKKGLKLHREGRIDLAEACHRKIVKIAPSSPEAEELLRALRPPATATAAASPLTAQRAEDADALSKRAASDLARGNVEAALKSFRRVAELRPESAQPHGSLAEAHEQLGNIPGAIESYRRALMLQPDSVDLHCHLARVLCQQGELRAAGELYQSALVLDPKRHDVYSDLGFVLTELGNFGAAFEAFRRSLKLNPRAAKTFASVGHMFERKGDLGSAAAAYRDAVKLDPHLRAAHLDLGFVLYGLGELAEADDSFRRVLALQPDSAEAKVNLGLIHLLQGNFSAGLAEYESRWMVGVGDERRFLQRRWKGEPLRGERILLYAEQGLGDTLHFARYVPLVAARGGEVVLEVQPPLHGLLAKIEGAKRVISRGDPLPEFTWQCPLMSLPFALGTAHATIPAKVPYIEVDPARASGWREKLAGDKQCIGLAWAGNPAHPRDRLRSIPLERLTSLFSIPGAAFYSLQFGAGREQISQLQPNACPIDRLIDLGDELKDFTHLAAIVANLDLVITIDSAVAHLAGALGKPVWILLNKGCDWRWFLDRENSPWYPTARLFRQSTAGDWQEVIERVEAALRGRAQN